MNEQQHYVELFKELAKGIEDGDFNDIFSVPQTYTYEHLLAMHLMSKSFNMGSDIYLQLLETAEQCGIAAVRKKLAEGGRVRVFFMSDSAAQWGAEKLYRILDEDPAFEVKLIVTPLTDRSEYAWKKRYNETCSYFEKNDYRLAETSEHVDDPKRYWDELGGYPDILIHSMPYFTSLAPAHQYTSMPFSTLHFYIPYGIYVDDAEGDYALNMLYNSPFMNAMCRIFCDSNMTMEGYKKNSLRRGTNVINSGYSKMDFFYEDKDYTDSDIRSLWKIPDGPAAEEVKRVIIAPHWSLMKTGGPQYATFDKNFRCLLKLAKDNDRVSFIFKPHPNLPMSAVESGLFKSPEEYEAYLEEWNALPNAKVAGEESYLQLFDTSDCMIMDSCSFIAEYMYTLKPMLFLTRPEQRFSPLGRVILETQYTCPGEDAASIESFLTKVSDNEDEKYDIRKEVFEKELDYAGIKGMKASERIAKEIQLLCGIRDERKKICIIIPCHDSADTLPRTWASILDQTMPTDELQVIFVDDASDDDGKTWQVLQDIEKQAPESVMIIALEENMRQGGARNVALQYVNSEYVLFLDSDDTYRRESCEELYALAKKYGSDLVEFKHRHLQEDAELRGVPETGEISGRVEVYDLDGNDENRKAVLGRQMSGCSCTNKMYSADLLERSGAAYAERVIYEEPLFVYPQFLYANKLVMVDKDYYEYHWHADSTMTSLLGKRLMEHPKVQLELMADVMAREELYKKYKEEIDYYFFQTFYAETVLFAYTNRGYISAEALEYLQGVCKKLVPEIRTNRYTVRYESMKWAADTIFKEYPDDQSVIELEREAAGRFNG
ncbi:MAG: glycosyltransferase [Lachnospiraceae bacterium]|nr:glycosyltransferase [Lachnospiraceae bacterium]